MRKTMALILTCSLLLALLSACTGPKEEPTPSPEVGVEETPTATDAALKTGLGAIAVADESDDADTGEEDGMAQIDVLMAAVLVGDDGIITDCRIDAVQAEIGFDAGGKLLTPADTVFASKDELGAAYGMGQVSSIGKEWNEQAAAFAAYVVGKTADEVAGIAMDDGKAADADLISSVTIHIGDFIRVVQKAVANAQQLGAQTGDELKLSSVAEMASSKDAQDGQKGLAQANVTMTAATFTGEIITSCVIDAAQVDVEFDQRGEITSDTDGEFMTKNELGEAYGMKKASAIGKEWNEQAAAFAAYAVGKTADEIAGIAVTDGRATDTDLASSVTIRVGVFQELLKKAAG